MFSSAVVVFDMRLLGMNVLAQVYFSLFVSIDYFFFFFFKQKTAYEITV